MARRKRLLVAPAIGDPETLVSIVARLAHYLAHVGVETISIPLSEGLSPAEAERIVAYPVLPLGFDPEVATRIPRIASQLRFFTATTGAPPPPIAADVLLFWDLEAKEEEPWRTMSRSFRPNRTRFDVDWERTRGDGSWFGQLALLWSKESRAFDKRESERFLARTERLLDSPTAYLVATGPSARQALEIDMTGGARIVCNTTILDDELMDHVRPDIVTFADPIFHFGPSTYAHQFQRALGRLAERHDFTVVTLERYAGLLRDRLPRLADRIAGVRLGLPSWPQNYDLMRAFAVRPYPNIMTMLMLPLAATFSRNIELIGFDGRNQSESYFWRHGSTVQFDRELSDIRHVHPGFFELDYEDYYDEHVRAVEQAFLDIEVRGGIVRSRTRSFMPPLRRRMIFDVDRPEPSSVKRRSSAAALVSITPDWTGTFGHFGPWERAVGAAARAAGFEYHSLASRALDTHGALIRPTFTHGTLYREGADHALFETELRAGLDATIGSGRATVCMYVSDIWHVPTILAVGRDRPTSTFVVNLMRTHPAIAAAAANADDNADVRIELLRECLAVARGTNVHICVDTQRAVDELERATGETALVWPMVMLSDTDKLREFGARRSGEPLTLVAPVQPQVAKGFHLLTELAERLAEPIANGSLVMTARHAPQPTGATPVIAKLAARFRAAGGRLLDDHFTDRGYAQLVGSAHAVLMPYQLASFRTRTSAVVLDAIAAGAPVIVTGGTWAGDIVDRCGLGATFADGDIDSFESAVSRVIDNLSDFTQRVAEARDGIVARFRPERLIDSFARLAVGRRPAPDKVRLDGLRRFASLASETFWKRDVVRNDQSVVHQIQLDDLDRARDDERDRIHVLKLANDWRQRVIDRLERGRPASPSESASPAATTLPSNAPAVTAQTKPAVPSDIDLAVYPRESAAHLDELALVAALVKPHTVAAGVMIDVGAHHGSAFRRFLEAGWRIHAFEPDPRHAEYLSERHSADDRVVLDTRAVSNVSGEKVTFYVSEESTGISGLSAFRESHVPIGEVETVALRDVAGIDRVDLLKIDTEGYERFVLDGFPWDRVHPAVVVAEFEDSKTKLLGYTTADLVDYLHGLGYQVWISEWHPIIRYGIRHQWHRLADSDQYSPDPNGWGNLVAFRQPVSPAAIGRALASVLTVGEPNR